MSELLYSFTSLTLTKFRETKLEGNYSWMLHTVFVNPGSNTQQNINCTATYPHLSNHQSKTIKTLLKNKGLILILCSLMDSYTWTHQYWSDIKNLYSSALCRLQMPSRGLAKSDYWYGRIARERARQSQWNPWCQNDLMMMIPLDR